MDGSFFDYLNKYKSVSDLHQQSNQGCKGPSSNLSALRRTSINDFHFEGTMVMYQLNSFKILLNMKKMCSLILKRFYLIGWQFLL